MNIEIFDKNNRPDREKIAEITDFLFVNLEQYSDPQVDIEKAVHYLLDERKPGGFILVSSAEQQLTGIAVVNATGMSGYIPEYILVYIATHKDYRRKGLGEQLMLKLLEMADGDMALHVEAHNPARFLYEKVGFKKKYVEMRYKKKKYKNGLYYTGR